jgi:hypothetical protein
MEDPGMRYLTLKVPNFYSDADESNFFCWLKTIPRVVDAVEESRGLIVSFRSRRLSQRALQDLIALHTRYGLPMEGLAQFQTSTNSWWFRAPEKYWHDRVFGKSNDPSSRFVRSPFVRFLADGGER